ncbi:two-component sensor histidine kinase [Sphingomonas jinjuensis]|uniref:histidine kinase n=1 Tax=Sphingomonas jinjuensis TaxID=535907 RepID=A0A840FIB9_9SPHN|nr:HWE histidine kinase domain-containing protein [Sphingomonas jinjuensis]MBB4155444.1 two-component sensor histidine kinase [Sphingomonas jinjuensis]
MGIHEEPRLGAAEPREGVAAVSASGLEVTVLGNALEDDGELERALVFSGIGCWVLELSTQRLRVTLHCKTIYGRPSADRFEMADMIAAIHPADRSVYNDAVDAAVRNGVCVDLDHRILLPDGSERWVELRGQAIIDQMGSGPILICTVQDITDRKQGDLHRALLASEMNHRVKNSFSLTQAVIHQTVRSAKSIREVATVLDLRLAALAVANDLLVSDVAGTATMVDVVRRALLPFGFGTTDHFQWAGPDVALPARVVASLSLVLHELATNASKFGALSQVGGSVRLVWQMTERKGQMRLSLTWREANGPPVRPPQRTGFGTRLIQRCLGDEIGGFTAIEFRIDGLLFTADLPMHESASTVAGTSLTGEATPFQPPSC